MVASPLGPCPENRVVAAFPLKRHEMRLPFWGIFNSPLSKGPCGWATLQPGSHAKPRALGNPAGSSALLTHPTLAAVDSLWPRKCPDDLGEPGQYWAREQVSSLAWQALLGNWSPIKPLRQEYWNEGLKVSGILQIPVATFSELLSAQIFFFLQDFIWHRKREWEREYELRGDGNADSLLSREPEIMTWAEGRLFNPLSHPGAPRYLLNDTFRDVFLLAPMLCHLYQFLCELLIPVSCLLTSNFLIPLYSSPICSTCTQFQSNL